MAAWAGPQVPFTLDFSAPFLPLIQGPQAFFAGMSQARRNSQEQQNRAEWQQSQQDAAMYGQLGQTLGNSIGNLTMGAVAAHGLRQPPAVGGDVGSPSPSFAEGGGSMSPFAGDMAGGTSAYDPGVSGGSPIAAQPQMDPMRRQMLQGMLAQSLGGPPAGSYLAQQMSADAGAGREFQGEFGMTQPQAQQQGQRIFQSAPAPVQQSMLQSAGLNSASDLTPQHYQRIATDAVQMNQLQMRGNARIQQEVQGEMMLQQAQQGQQLVQAVDDGAIELATPQLKAEYQELVTNEEKAIREMTTKGVRPEQIAQVKYQLQQQRAAHLQSKPKSAFIKVLTEAQKFAATIHTEPDGSRYTYSKNKYGGYDTTPLGMEPQKQKTGQQILDERAGTVGGQRFIVGGDLNKPSITEIKPDGTGVDEMTRDDAGKLLKTAKDITPSTFGPDGTEILPTAEEVFSTAEAADAWLIKRNAMARAVKEQMGPPMPPESGPPNVGPVFPPQQGPPQGPPPGAMVPRPQGQAPAEPPPPLIRFFSGFPMMAVPGRGGRPGSWQMLPGALTQNQLLEVESRARSELINKNPKDNYVPTQPEIDVQVGEIYKRLEGGANKEAPIRGSLRKDAQGVGVVAPQGQPQNVEAEWQALKQAYPDASKAPPEVKRRVAELLKMRGG